jgi:hypothetical protein
LNVLFLVALLGDTTHRIVGFVVEGILYLLTLQTEAYVHPSVSAADAFVHL